MSVYKLIDKLGYIHFENHDEVNYSAHYDGYWYAANGQQVREFKIKATNQSYPFRYNCIKSLETTEALLTAISYQYEKTPKTNWTLYKHVRDKYFAIKLIFENWLKCTLPTSPSYNEVLILDINTRKYIFRSIQCQYSGKLIWEDISGNAYLTLLSSTDLHIHNEQML